MQADLTLRLEVETLYARYVAMIDEGPLAALPTLFTEDALLKITSRENVDRGWRLALMLAESRAAIEDRVHAIEHLTLTIPRRMRHVVTGILPVEQDGAISVEANFAVFETLEGQQTVCFATGRYRDVLHRRAGGGLLFQEKIAICDSALIRNSLVYPL